MSKNEKTYAEHPVDLRTQVLEVDLCEVFYFELDAWWHEYLLGMFVEGEDPEALLEGLDLLLAGTSD